MMKRTPTSVAEELSILRKRSSNIRKSYIPPPPTPGPDHTPPGTRARRMSVVEEFSILRERSSNIRQMYIPPPTRVAEELSILRKRSSNIRKSYIPPHTPDHPLSLTLQPHHMSLITLRPKLLRCRVRPTSQEVFRPTSLNSFLSCSSQGVMKLP
jgi:hypothetical protein